MLVSSGRTKTRCALKMLITSTSTWEKNVHITTLNTPVKLHQQLILKDKWINKIHSTPEAKLAFHFQKEYRYSLRNSPTNICETSQAWIGEIKNPICKKKKKIKKVCVWRVNIRMWSKKAEYGKKFMKLVG